MYGGALIALVSAALAGCSPGPSSIAGVVVDRSGEPLAGVRVRLQGTTFFTDTAAEGLFRLSFPRGGDALVLTAWKEGYFNGGGRLSGRVDDPRIVLEALPDRRSEGSGRAWVSARGADREACAPCHPVLAIQWERSAHGRSATNPLFLAAYDGRDRAGASTGGPAYRLDFPSTAGNCATCHVPALAAEAPFAADPREAAGVAAEGVFCDLCHKIQQSTIDEGGGRPGVLSLELVRPAAGAQLFLGPLDDVIGRPDSFSPLYRQSRYCAPCHQGRFWNVAAYTEFEEWAASSYARQGVQCQDCHMKAEPGPPRRFARAEVGGILRDPTTLSSHALRGVDDPGFMRAALAVTSDATLLDGTVRVRVSVKNVGAGHHVPTGSPMRNMVLLVEATDARLAPLTLLSGSRTPAWAGGTGPESGDHAGKGFAKVLVDLVEYPSDRPRGRAFAPVFPAPYWRPTAIAADTRIAAGATDLSEYRFRLNGAGPVTVKTRLIYRRTFRSWGRLSLIKDGDLELAASEAHLEGPQGRGP